MTPDTVVSYRYFVRHAGKFLKNYNVVKLIGNKCFILTVEEIRGPSENPGSGRTR